MDFNNIILKKLFADFKWSRNNTIQIFDKALQSDILDFKSTTPSESEYIFQPLVFQFQCIISTTDTYIRKLTNSKNQQFGILIIKDRVIRKNQIEISEIKKLLKAQLIQLEDVYTRLNNDQLVEKISLINTISNHEYLHQGQMIIAFRESGNDLPDRFKKAWAL